MFHCIDGVNKAYAHNGIDIKFGIETTETTTLFGVVRNAMKSACNENRIH